MMPLCIPVQMRKSRCLQPWWTEVRYRRGCILIRIKGEFTGTPDGSVHGVLSIKVTARDNVGNEVETIFHIQINERHSQLMTGKTNIAMQFRREGVMGWKAERDKLVRHAQEIAAKNNVPGRQYDHVSNRST